MKELDRLKQLQSLTGKLAQKLDSFGTQIDKMNEGSKSVVEVTSNWNQIIRTIGLAANSVVSLKDEDYKNGHPLTERLVRCKLNEKGEIVGNSSKSS